MGPPCDPIDGWGVTKGQLHCSYHRSIMEQFNADYDNQKALADKRWVEYYGALDAGPYNNGCYATCQGSCGGPCTPVTPPATGYCYLKYSSEGAVAKPGVTMCVPSGSGGNCTFTDASDVQNGAGGSSVAAADAAACCAACRADAQCAAAVYQPSQVPICGSQCPTNFPNRTTA